MLICISEKYVARRELVGDSQEKSKKIESAKRRGEMV